MAIKVAISLYFLDARMLTLLKSNIVITHEQSNNLRELPDSIVKLNARLHSNATK